MVLSEAERLSQKMDAAGKYIHRAKVRDSSELTFIKQARAGSVELPQQVTGVKERDGAACQFTTQGKGVNMEYGNVLLKKQSCAICPDVDPVVNPGITIPCCSTTTISSFYTAPCRIPGYNVFFPPRVTDGKNCVLNREFYGSYP